MRIPKRKSEEDKRALKKDGPIYLTSAGIQSMKDEMERIKQEVPGVREELIQTREMGDLSENAGYQIAKATLRRLQNRLLRLEEDMKRVIEIKPELNGRVGLGSVVRVALNGQEMEFSVVGPRESDPGKGYISHRSPLGQQLLRKQVGDEAVLKRDDRDIVYTILEIK